MEAREKWVELFEKVVGRKPSPDEFLKGKATDFKLTEIRRIAGLDVVQSETQEDVVVEPVTTVEEVAPAHPQSFQPEPEVISEVVEEIQPVRIKAIAPEKRKGKKWLFAIIALLLAALVAGYFYMKSITGMEVATKNFVVAAQSNDYDQIATLLSTDEVKWDKAQAKSFMTYLTDNQIDAEQELETIVASGGKNVYHDYQGNRLFSLTQTGKKFGLFPEYQVTVDPIEVWITTNLSDLTVNGTKVASGEPTSVGRYPFAPTEFKVTATTSLGKIDTSVQTQLNNSENNQISMALETSKKNVEATLPSEITVSELENLQLFANGKEIAKSLQGEIEVLNHQEVEFQANFTYEGASYSTSKKKVVVSQDEPILTAELTLTNDVMKRISEAQKAKADEEADLAAKESELTRFLVEYREEVNYSIEHRTNTYSQYYDTASAVYKEMSDYTEGGGVRAANVDYHIAGDFRVENVSQKDGNYVVEAYGDFTQVLMNGKKVFVRKNYVYYLRPAGDSYQIYDIDVTNL